MKNYLRVLILCVLGLAFTGVMDSCKVKEGCGLEEKYNNPDMESSKRGTSNLFSNSQRKKMKPKKGR